MKHVFCAVVPQPTAPKVGDLIRNTQTGDFINIVLEVYAPKEDSRGFISRQIRSVRYGVTNGGEFVQLHGTRSRLFPYHEDTSYNT